jgi:hypothetical protein
LPSECPLLNHVLLSYQKHHDPSNQPIREDEESQDMLSVLRPLKGIDQSKYQPIIRQLNHVKVNLNTNEVDKKLAPLKEVLKESEVDLIKRVLAENPTKVKEIAPQEDKQVQSDDHLGDGERTDFNKVLKI